MDELLIFGCIVLLFVGVVVPILAIVALNRTSAFRFELAVLRRRLEELEQRGVTEKPAMPQAEAVTTAQRTEPEATLVVPEPVAAVVPEPADPWLSRAKPAPAAREPDPVNAVTKDPEPSALGGMITSLVRWFMQGNPLAKLGILLLFFGLSFLLRYTVEHSLFPLELRLVAAALFALVLLATG